MAALWLCRGEPLFFQRDGAGRLRPYWSRGRSALALASFGLISLAGPYYAFFATFFLIVAGLIAQLRRPGLVRLCDAVLLAGLVAGSLALQLAPFVAHSLGRGANPAALGRKVSDYYLYGLRIANLLMPTTGHRIAFLREVSLESRRKPFESLAAAFHQTNEAVTCTPLGVAGSAGFLALVALALGRPRRVVGRMPPLADLCALNLAALLLAVIGGFGELIAWYVTARIRCYNRISIFIAFFSIFAIALMLSRLWRERSAAGRGLGWLALLLGLGLALGLLDEIPGVIAPDYARDRAAFASDRRFVRRLEESLPPGSQVFQLPAASFPEFGILFRMYDYDQFRGYLHSRRLRWSYGALRGRDAEQWQSQLALLPFSALISRLAEAHFAGLWVNRRGYVDGGEALIRDLSRLLPQEPIVSPDGQLLFFRLPGEKN
jgi:hypothetical protein